MGNEMLKRVSEAVAKTAVGCGIMRDSPDSPWVTGPAYQIARAAIAAMREPNDAIVDRLGDALGDRPEDHETARLLWRTMIDEGLAADCA